MALASVLGLGGGAFAFGWPSVAADPVEGADVAPARPKVVVVDPVQAVDASRRRRFAGTLQANRNATLSFTIPGRMVSREVDVGDRVAPGDVLARLDRRAYRHQLRAARASAAQLDAQRDQADRDADRMDALAATRSVPAVQAERSRTELEALSAGGDAADASVSEARRLLGEAELAAPFSGTVNAVLLEPGEYANPGVPVVELVGDGALELLVEVPETVITHLRADSSNARPATVVFPLLEDREVVGTLKASAEGARGPARLFPVRVAVPREPGLLPGMTAELVVETPVRASASVPVDAVINPGGERPSVFVVREGRVARVPVDVIDVVEGRAMVRGELELGEPVVVGGHAGLAAGVEVEVRS